MKLAIVLTAAALGLLLLLIGALALWVIFSQIFAGTDKEGTNIYLAPVYALIAAGGVALWIPIIRLARRGAR